MTLGLTNQNSRMSHRGPVAGAVSVNYEDRDTFCSLFIKERIY